MAAAFFLALLVTVEFKNVGAYELRSYPQTQKLMRGRTLDLTT